MEERFKDGRLDALKMKGTNKRGPIGIEQL